MPGVPHPTLGLIAVVFVMAGLGFRVAAVPFHFYAPDVYQGSPDDHRGAAGLGPEGDRLRGDPPDPDGGHPGRRPPAGDHLTHQAVVLAWIIAVVTMTLGNTVALAQTNLKRLLAYSSIAHAGYLMIGVAVAFRNGAIDAAAFTSGGEGVLFYLVAYALMTLGAFARDHRPEHARAAGRDGRRPRRPGRDRTRAWPLAMAICLFSLAGIPPLAGFVGKFNLFVAAFSAVERRRRPDVPVAGDDRRDQLGDRGVLLPQDRRRDVLPGSVRGRGPPGRSPGRRRRR